MPRPRKDGKPAARAIRIGVERTSSAGKKWRVRSYAPTDGASYGRVVYVSPTTGKPTSKVPEDGQTLDTVFDQVERALTQKVAMGTGTDGNGKPDVRRRDLRALSEMYLDYLRSKGRDDDYIANRKSMLRKWILPSIGSVLVAEWCTEHNQGVITKARAGELGGDRVADLGSTLSGMRMTAWRRRPGGRWLRHAVRGYSRFAHIDGLIPSDPAVYARLPKVHRDESRTQGLDRLELIRFLQVAQTISVHHGALAYLLGINAVRASEAAAVRIEDYADTLRGHRVLHLVVVRGEPRRGGVNGELVLMRDELAHIAAVDLRRALSNNASFYEADSCDAEVSDAPEG